MNIKRNLYILLLFVLPTTISFAQNDSIYSGLPAEKSFFRKQLLPVSLIAGGALLNIGTIKYDIQEVFPDTHTHVEDYFQYAPMAQIYIFDAFGFKHRNNVFDQTKYLALSQLFSGSLVHFLKHTTKVERPWGGKTSFPSGHTTTAFTGATVLYHEFKDTEPLLAWSGYLFATATGAIRVTNNAHWLPDVLAAAGIGILTTNLVYYFEPLEKFQPFKKKKKLSFVPVISAESMGFQCRF
jgi:hypothetical protein